MGCCLVALESRAVWMRSEANARVGWSATPGGENGL